MVPLIIFFCKDVMKLKIMLLCVFCVGIFSGGCFVPDRKGELEKVFADSWEYGLVHNPLFATHFGDHRFDDKLPEETEAKILEEVAFDRQCLERLGEIDRNKLSDADKINYDIFKRNKEKSIEWRKFRTYLMPISQMRGFHTYFPQLHERTPLNNVREYENYIARLEAFRRYTRQHIELMRTGIADGFVLPSVVMGTIEDTISAHIVDDPAESLLYTPFKNFPADISAAEQKQLSIKAKSAVTESVVPAYREFLEFVKNEYVPAGRDDISIAALPNGKEYYEYCVRYHTSDDMTAGKIHEIGLSEVKRIRAEMLEVIAATGFEGSFAEFSEFLKTDEQFYCKSAEELLKEVSYIAKRIDSQLPKLFNKLPRMPFGIKEVPEYMSAKSPAAYYWRPTGDGITPGYYYINTGDLTSSPLYEMEPLCLHEAMPGHHLQIALQMELEDVPHFRKYSWFTAYGEGWALYAESLGKELGMYADPYNDFGRLIFEMWRACRLVVDTGIHSKGWTRQRAIDFMKENAATSDNNVETEVDRYIVWPGQALAYKIGELKIKSLRQKAKAKLGENFDIRQFHDVVLGNGTIPLNVLEANVNEWINAQIK